ncbi:MAG: metalloregulator ArsR/SmtB family transcription factor [Anaerolineales bacterium]
MNMFSVAQGTDISKLFKVIGDPFRVRLLMVLADTEACVCHLACLLDKRQPYISQHLMSLRQAGLLDSRRDGKYIFYSLKNKELVGLLKRAANLIGLQSEEMPSTKQNNQLARCECPQCGNARLISIK